MFSRLHSAGFPSALLLPLWAVLLGPRLRPPRRPVGGALAARAHLALLPLISALQFPLRKPRVYLNSFFNYIGLTLVNNIIYVSGVRVCNTSSVYCIVCIILILLTSCYWLT